MSHAFSTRAGKNGYQCCEKDQVGQHEDEIHKDSCIKVPKDTSEHENNNDMALAGRTSELSIFVGIILFFLVFLGIVIVSSGIDRA